MTTKKKYNIVDEIMAPFKDRNRMDVSRLSREEATEPNRALSLFPEIPDWFLTEKENKDRFGLANLHYLLGQAAYYPSQITVALDHFRRAVKLYGDDYHDDIKKKLLRAFCSHYLGLIDKNWCPVGLDKGLTLDSAKRHLHEAWELLKADEKELLTPITLAEVCSYSPRNRPAAIAQLGSWKSGRLDDATVEFDSGTIKNIFDLAKKTSSGLDPYQSELLTRALLIRGNIEFVENRPDAALVYYDLAYQHDSENPYALLSMAQANSDAKVSATLFEKGWDAVQNSGLLSRRENSSKLLALAWGVIANHALQRKVLQNRFLKDLTGARSSVHAVAKREPLFFCPISKGQVFFSDLLDNIRQATKEDAGKAA